MRNQFDKTKQEQLLADWRKLGYPFLLAMGKRLPGQFIELDFCGRYTARLFINGRDYGLINFEGE